MLRLAWVLLPALLAATPVNAQSPTSVDAVGSTPVGVWQDVSNRIQVEIVPCGDRLCGTLVWFRWPNDAEGLPLVDLMNKDPALRGRPLLGLTILQGLRRTSERTWEDGKIYNPQDGVNYQARMSIRKDGALRLRAYVLLPILGKTHIWTRIR